MHLLPSNPLRPGETPGIAIIEGGRIHAKGV